MPTCDQQSSDDDPYSPREEQALGSNGPARSERARTAVRARQAAAIAALVVVVDGVSKVAASAGLDDRTVELGSVMTLRLSHNPGVAFGLGERLPGPALLALTALVTLALVVAAARGVLAPALVAGLVVGGAVANLADRAVGGTVVDFLDLGWWPSFNLADVALVVGCGLLAIASFRAPADPS